ncbi:MAG: ACP S-malonyltransferase [Pseudomonadota bacterium]
MVFALTFPGQGSQSVGMGKSLYDEFADSRAVFDEVDEALGEKLSALIFNGPEETLTLTANAQPALMAVSLAAVRAMEAQGFDVTTAAYVAGHSLGEYSALAASGAISVGETAKLLRVRGNAMQAAVPVGVGAMAAIIGLEDSDVTAICESASTADNNCQIANDNGGGQLVISGHAEAIEKAIALATEKGAKRAIPLSVSAPFHSSLMAPAADAMQEALANANVNDAKVPVVANVLASPITGADEIRQRLVEQVTGRVRWRETVEFFAANGVETAAEVGAGRVLSGLARRIARDIKGVAVGTSEQVAPAIDALK